MIQPMAPGVAYGLLFLAALTLAVLIVAARDWFNRNYPGQFIFKVKVPKEVEIPPGIYLGHISNLKVLGENRLEVEITLPETLEEMQRGK